MITALLTSDAIRALPAVPGAHSGDNVKVASIAPRLLVPSIEKLLMFVGVPLTEKFTERVGFAAKEFPFCASDTPGSVGMSNW